MNLIFEKFRHVSLDKNKMSNVWGGSSIFTGDNPPPSDPGDQDDEKDKKDSIPIPPPPIPTNPNELP